MDEIKMRDIVNGYARKLADVRSQRDLTPQESEMLEVCKETSEMISAGEAHNGLFDSFVFLQGALYGMGHFSLEEINAHNDEGVPNESEVGTAN